MTDITANDFDLLDNIYDRNVTRFGFLLDFEINNVFLGLDIVLIFNMYISHYKLWLMIKREKRKRGHDMVKNLLASYSIIVPLVFTVLSTYLNILTRYSHPPWIISGHWFCISVEGFCHTSIVYIGGFSLFVAATKYLFIVHHVRAKDFGEAKAIKILTFSHFIFPLVMALLNSSSNGRIDQLFMVDHCWSFQGWRFNNPNMTTSEQVRSFFCMNREYDISDYFDENLKHTITQMLRVLCVCVKLTYLVLLSNVVETLLYSLIFKYLNRYSNVFIIRSFPENDVAPVWLQQ